MMQVEDSMFACLCNMLCILKLIFYFCKTIYTDQNSTVHYNQVVDFSFHAERIVTANVVFPSILFFRACFLP